MAHFTLLDAMNAIEVIMDPRMDNGVTLPNENESKTSSFDPQAPLSSEEISWILDRAVAAEGEDFHAEKFEVGLCEGLQTNKVLESLDSAEQRLNEWTAQLSHLRSARSLLDDIISSPSPSEPVATSPARAAFDPAICRKLVVVTPLKPIELSNQGQAWTILKNELDGLIGMYEIAEQGTSADWMILMKSRPPQWTLDLVYRHIVPIQHDYILSLASSLSQHMLVGGAAHDSHLLLNGVMDLQRRLQEVLDHFLLSLNQNRPRTRRNFAKVLSAWHKIEADATQLMITIRAPLQHIRLAAQVTYRLPLVIHHFRLAIITEYVMAGFELELYETSEWPFLYWYVAVILGEQVGTLNDLLQTLDQDSESQEAASRLENTLKWCEGLQRLCWGRFVMLVPLIGTAALTPHMDLDRQRRNMMKRFDWSIPSASESSVLEDSGRPDWNAYETAVARLKGRE
ncbi:hypothetical protein FRC00_009630, partial [Tulasnella sp. 408]